MNKAAATAIFKSGTHLLSPFGVCFPLDLFLLLSKANPSANCNFVNGNIPA